MVDLLIHLTIPLFSVNLGVKGQKFKYHSCVRLFNKEGFDPQHSQLLLHCRFCREYSILLVHAIQYGHGP